MKSIDFRCRPPYKSFTTDWFYGEEILKACEQMRGKEAVSEAAWKKSMELFLQEMDKNEVEKGVAIARVEFGPLLGNKVENAYVSNDDVTDLVTEYPDRFIGVASVNLTDTEQALNDIDKYVVNGKLSGVVIEPGYCEPALAFDDRILYPIYEKCQKEHIFVLLGTGMVYHDLKTSKPEAFEQVAIDFPELTIIVGHGGWPYVVESCFVAATRPNVYLSPDNFMVKRPGAEDFLYALNAELGNKMLFGTAYPFLSFEASLDWAKKTVREDVLEDYLYNNAARILGIK
jgi:hypothetical protein